ncbi:SitA6 family polymorphic toxin lipoprotein [Archangium lipolyticum]
MRLLASRRGLGLLCMLLVACATSTPGVREDEAPLGAVSSWDEARADPSCVVPLCSQESCSLWRCVDLVEEEASSVVLARGPGVLRPPLVVGSPSRWWGRSIAAPANAEPVFEIPWHNWSTRDPFARRELRIPCIVTPREPYEKHHIFPQERELAEWFASRNIDIHAFTVRLPESFHTWLHSGGPKGGQWNEAWRQFMRKNYKTATAEDMWRFAFELMMRFGVNGPLVPYYCE